MEVTWSGVYPAVTTQFRADQSVDLEATAAHAEHLIRAGVHGLIMLGSVGENTVLDPTEKRAVLATAIEAVQGRVPVLSGVAESSTAGACRFAADAEAAGADGLMVLPAMIYKTDRRETIAHFRAVARASDLPVMCYNNPVSYGTDLTPEMFAELADEPTLIAIKESSDDVRRITDLVNLVGERYILFCGVDDLILEAALLGVSGWVAGLVNAFPEESVRLWDLAAAGRWAEARALYRWFTPLLHLDVHVKLVQYIKLAQAMAGLGTETTRAPRLALEGEERQRIAAIIQAGLDARPRLAAE
jgi:4-hydroxy-tetrahydrodipicolinate synthase